VARPKDAVCAEIYSRFERCENLGLISIPGETYTVYVNDKRPVSSCLKNKRAARQDTAGQSSSSSVRSG
jgi:hypothetical protein